ncbi:MAG TPA: BamA/TamA family outer membrane protein [Luteitalea sp.]|nr:BamA/TamA family outer membrane protein [Luteitalea sp.]
MALTGAVRAAFGTLACSLCLATTAPAQTPSDTRAAEIEALRRAKAEAIAEAPKPGKVEAAINYVEQSRIFPKLFNPPKGWFAQIGGVSEGNGFTLGGGYRQPTALGVVTARAVGSLRQSYLGSVEIRRPILPREAGFVAVTLTRRHEAAQRYFGLGGDTAVADRSSFGLSASALEVTSGVKITSWLTGTASIGYLAPEIVEGSETRRIRDARTAFTDATAPGLSDQPSFLTTQVAAIIDTRDTTNPRRGGFYQASLRRYQDQDGGQYGFTGTRIDLQQFIPFWNESRVLALRVLADHTDGLGEGQVPFYLMPTLGGARLLRGYDRQRYRDRSLLLLSAEYRYEINPFLMAALFYDAGQVAPDWTDFRTRDLRDAYGIGFRFGYSSAVALRSDIVFGGEDPIRLILGFTTSF